MADTADQRRPPASLETQRAMRQTWEQRERIAELEASLAEHVERERIWELELAAMRKDLEVKSAYNTMLERNAMDQRKTIEWLQSRAENADSHLAVDRRRVEALEADLLAVRRELALERARLSYRLVQPVVRAAARTRMLSLLSRRLRRRPMRRKA